MSSDQHVLLKPCQITTLRQDELEQTQATEVAL
jgi:hypothetical protein